ncbi:unnamed protein product [Ascophyllum nodosum]
MGKDTAPPERMVRPLTRKDVPKSKSTVNLFKGIIEGKFSDRQRHCLAKDATLGPIYEAVMEECEQWADKPTRFSLCCSREVCPVELKDFLSCVRATGDASLCHEFRDEVERCGVRMSQRMLKAALSDDWF